MVRWFLSNNVAQTLHCACRKRCNGYLMFTQWRLNGVCFTHSTFHSRSETVSSTEKNSSSSYFCHLNCIVTFLFSLKTKLLIKVLKSNIIKLQNSEKEQNMVRTQSTPIVKRSSRTRASTSDGNVDSRSSSPTPVFRQSNPLNGIRIITDLSSTATTSQRSAETVSAPGQIDGSNENYQEIYSTLYLCSEMKLHSKKLAKEFSLPEPWLSEHLSDYQPENCRATETNERCMCCLCKWRHRSGNTEICIKNHPCDTVSCTIGQESRPKHTMLKYQKQNVCDVCTAALTLNTRKTKQKSYRCLFHPCSAQFKSITSLRKHYFEHLKVKNFVCSICEKDYRTRNGLKMHERKH